MKHAALTLLLCLPALAVAQQAEHKGSHPHPELGVVSFANSGNVQAQPAFQRGVALLHSFEYDDAAAAFREAQAADPSLALAYWLEALTYSHIVWGEEDLAGVRATLARLAATSTERIARARSERERAFGTAIEAFYADAPLAARTRAFADSMTGVAAAYPSDQEAAVFAALANMLAWFSNPPAERARFNEPVKQNALRVFRQNAQHPGAAHYLIHFVDMNPTAAAGALEFARAYDQIAPAAEHALHMPSHVYLPLGLWGDVAAANERAWPAARREVADKRLSPAYNSWHSLDWLQYAYLQLGRAEAARALIDTARTLLSGAVIEDDNPDARNIVNLLAFRYGLETGKWDAYPDGLPSVDVVLAQPRPNPRAVGMATTAAYQAAVAALRARHDTMPATKVVAAFHSEASGQVSEARRSLLNRLSKQLAAMIAHERGDHERAIAWLAEIAPTEPNNASVPPTTIPSYELLGDYLLAAGRRAEAADAYRQALQLRPNRRAAVQHLERARTP